MIRLLLTSLLLVASQTHADETDDVFAAFLAEGTRIKVTVAPNPAEIPLATYLAQKAIRTGNEFSSSITGVCNSLSSAQLKCQLYISTKRLSDKFIFEQHVIDFRVFRKNPGPGYEFPGTLIKVGILE